MLQEMSKEQVKNWHQEIRDWVEDVIDGKYGRFGINMLSSMMNGFKDMQEDISRFVKREDEEIAKNRKAMGLPPLKKQA